MEASRVLLFLLVVRALAGQHGTVTPAEAVDILEAPVSDALAATALGIKFRMPAWRPQYFAVSLESLAALEQAAEAHDAYGFENLRETGSILSIDAGTCVQIVGREYAGLIDRLSDQIKRFRANYRRWKSIDADDRAVTDKAPVPTPMQNPLGFVLIHIRVLEGSNAGRILWARPNALLMSTRKPLPACTDDSAYTPKLSANKPAAKSQRQ